MRKTNKNLVVIITVFIIIGLLITSYYAFFYQETQPEKQVQEEKKIDDRINPLGPPQSVFLETHRIRKKGIIDVMMNSGSHILDKLPFKNPYVHQYLDGIRPGFGWRDVPTFTYVAVFDDYEFTCPKDFATWDTGYIDNGIFRQVKEEQPTATIQYKIVEKQKKLFKTTEKEMESFSLIYDFKTGRWSGDDYFNDSDGYGHYNGSNYEIWFTVRQSDYDNDGIPYWTEVNVLGTDPKVDDSKMDPDGDGIPTAWEWFWGYNPFTWDNHSYLDPDKDGLQNIKEYKMSKWLANPYSPDIYTEVDHMERAPFRPIEIKMEKGRILPITRPRLVKTNLDGTQSIFHKESQEMIMDEYNKHGITVHIDDGCMGGGGDIIPFMEPGTYDQANGLWGEYYNHKFADDRKGTFRYLIVAHSGGWAHPQSFTNHYDMMVVPNNFEFNRKFASLAWMPRTTRIAQAVAVLHELGHTCGLRGEEWGGVDNASKDWTDYKSSMSYYWFGLRYFGYSDGTHGVKDRNDFAALDIGYFQRPAESAEGVGWK